MASSKSRREITKNDIVEKVTELAIKREFTTNQEKIFLEKTLDLVYEGVITFADIQARIEKLIKIPKGRLLTFQTLKALLLSDEERLNFIKKGIWVGYPRAEQVIEEFDELLEQPITDRMDGGTLIATTGNGKTTTVKEYIARKQKEEPDARFLYVLAPDVPSPRAFYMEILERCGITPSGSAMEMKHKVLRLLTDMNVKMLFVDEIHNLLTAQNQKILQQCLDVLKNLSNQLQIPIVLIGTEKAEEVILSDDQVLDRYEVIHLPKWKKNKEFRLLLVSFEKSLPLWNSSKLYLKENYDLIYQLSNGIIGRMAKTIRRATVQAIKSGEEQITKKIVQDMNKNKLARKLRKKQTQKKQTQGKK